MNIFRSMIQKIREVFSRLIPYKSIEQAEHVDSSLSRQMEEALELWYDMYLDRASWVNGDDVKSLNIAAFVSSELARQMVLELKVNISGKGDKTEEGELPTNERSEYLKEEFQKLLKVLRTKLEQGCASGGMLIKPYPNVKDGHIYFDWVMDWALYPMAFDDDGELSDVIIPDSFTEGKYTYTRLERHQRRGDVVHITQRAFRSMSKDNLGSEVQLSEVERWSSLHPELDVKNTDGCLFGWFKVANANSIDVDSPMGASCFAKAVNTIREADMQYSRLLWEYQGSELAIDVDPSVLRPRNVTTPEGKVVLEMPKLNQRLFRAVDADKGDRDLYDVFSPNIRDGNIINGLNQLLSRIEDQCGLSRGTLSDPNVDARTATEFKIVRQRSYATVHDNQTSLERCLTEVLRVMDMYATLYKLAPEGDYDVSFEWDDSIITDKETEMQDRLMLFNAGIISRQEMREWYFGETKAQAKAAIDSITQEQTEATQANLAAQMSMMPPDIE